MSNEQRKLLCAVCNRKKGLHLFYKRSTTKRGYTKECKSCYRQRPAHQRTLNTHYRRNFGITLEEYETLLLEQGGRCFICRKRPQRRRLAVDHDHSRARASDVRSSVRGLLCNTCNDFLGHVGDEAETGLRLFEFLTRPYWVDRNRVQ